AGAPGALVQAPLLLGDPVAHERELDLAARDILLAAGELELPIEDFLAEIGAFSYEELAAARAHPLALGCGLLLELLPAADELLGRLLGQLSLAPGEVGPELLLELVAAPVELGP